MIVPPKFKIKNVIKIREATAADQEDVWQIIRAVATGDTFVFHLHT